MTAWGNTPPHRSEWIEVVFGHYATRHLHGTGQATSVRFGSLPVLRNIPRKHNYETERCIWIRTRKNETMRYVISHSKLSRGVVVKPLISSTIRTVHTTWFALEGDVCVSLWVQTFVLLLLVLLLNKYHVSSDHDIIAPEFKLHGKVSKVFSLSTLWCFLNWISSECQPHVGTRKVENFR